MNCVWIGFEKDTGIDTVINALEERFNILKSYRYNSFEELGNILEELKSSNVNDRNFTVFYEVKKNNSEFPIVLEFLHFNDLVEEMRIDVYIAYYLSTLLKCRTITDGTGLGIDNDIPYQDIVFDNGNAFLVDDMETKFYGDGNCNLKLIRKLDLKEICRRV